MPVKILFFDTSALLKVFIDEPGSEVVKWLVSPRTRCLFSLVLYVNEQVCSEFDDRILEFTIRGRLSIDRAAKIRHKFNAHYKSKVFKLAGQDPISNSFNKVDIDQVNSDLSLVKDKNDWDGLHYQSLVNALGFLVGESHPFLVSSDVKFVNKVSRRGFRVINPQKMPVGLIAEELA